MFAVILMSVMCMMKVTHMTMLNIDNITINLPYGDPLLNLPYGGPVSISPNSPFGEPQVSILVQGLEMNIQETINTILTSWRLVERIAGRVSVGQKFFSVITADCPSIAAFFMHLDIEQQSTVFMRMMHTLIMNLPYNENGSTVFDDYLKRLADVHVNKYHVKRQHFFPFWRSFMITMKATIPWSAERELAWSWFWDRVLSHLNRATQVNALSAADFGKARYVYYSLEFAIKSNTTGFGAELYNQLSAEQPGVGVLAKHFRSVEVGIAQFVGMIREVTVMLLRDEVPDFYQKMKTLGVLHRVLGINQAMLQSIGEMLTGVVKKKSIMVEPWTQKHDNAWDWFWAIISDSWFSLPGSDTYKAN